MFIINQENWKVVKKTNIIGSNNKNKIDLIQKDDLIIIYAIRPLSSILGSYKIITKSILLSISENSFVLHKIVEKCSQFLKNYDGSYTEQFIDILEREYHGFFPVNYLTYKFLLLFFPIV